MSEVTVKELAQGMALTDVALVVIKTAAKGYGMKTATEASIKARVDSGKKTVLRKRNTLLAQNNTEDLILGYDIDLTDCLTHPEVVALIDGGTVVNGAEGAFESYTGPVMGQEVTRTVFTMDVYCANRDTGNNVLDYNKLSFTGCKGKSAVEWDIKDGEFFTPKLSIETAPAVGAAPMSMDVVKTLPVITA